MFLILSKKLSESWAFSIRYDIIFQISYIACTKI